MITELHDSVYEKKESLFCNLAPLTYSALLSFGKLTFKKKRETLNGHASRTKTLLESRLRFQKVHLIFFKRVLLSACSTNVNTEQGALPPTAPTTPTVARRAERVNDDTEKILNLLIFLYFFRE